MDCSFTRNFRKLIERKSLFSIVYVWVERLSSVLPKGVFYAVVNLIEMRWKDGPVSFQSYLPCFVPSLFFLALPPLHRPSRWRPSEQSWIVGKRGHWRLGHTPLVKHPAWASVTPESFLDRIFFSPKFHLHNPSLNTPQTHMRTHTHTHIHSFTLHTHLLDHVQYKVDGHFRESRTTLNSTIQAGDGRFAFVLWLYWTAAVSHRCWNKSWEVFGIMYRQRWDSIVGNRP